MSRVHINHHIYNSTRWRGISKIHKMQHPLCEECLLYNILTPVDICDHVKEIQDHPELTWDLDNLRSLCHSCHNNKTADEVRKRNEVDNTYATIADFFD